MAPTKKFAKISKIGHDTPGKREQLVDEMENIGLV